MLVVDDDPDVRTSLADLLFGEGFDVEIAVDGRDALACFERSAHFDAIVCDLDMPRLDGAGLVRTLRRRGEHQVVVILSGRFDLLATTGLGQVYALSKPFEPDRLMVILRQALEERC